jgi:hypothetical protein
MSKTGLWEKLITQTPTAWAGAHRKILKDSVALA